MRKNDIHTLTQETPDASRQRVALLVEYDGAAYSGSQFQPGRLTLQGVIQDALAALNLRTSAVTFAGRTDAGVHARGQVAHFDIAEGSLGNIPNLQRALNARLRNQGVMIRNIRLNSGLDFHSRRDAVCKWYRYRIFNAGQESLWAPSDSVWMREPLNTEAMNQAAQAILGTHNFKSFKCPNTDVQDDVCNIRHARVQREGHQVIFDIVGERFLYKMVRNLMGLLIEIGQHDSARPVERLLEVLDARERNAASISAPPGGLSLMAIQYPEPYHFFESDEYVQQLNTWIYPNKPNYLNTMESLQNENLFRKAS